MITFPQTVRLISLSDERGTLSMLASPAGRLPFDVKRVFYLHGTTPDARRGGHAHREQQQIVLCLAGRVRARTETFGAEGNLRMEWLLQPHTDVLHVPPRVWLELYPTPDAIVLVLASGSYDPAEYVRDREELEAMTALPGVA